MKKCIDQDLNDLKGHAESGGRTEAAAG
jgi:hypothetical protein